jgi:site-specific recombinase XerD
MWLIGFSSVNTRDAYRYDLDMWLNYCYVSGLDPLTARRVHVEAWTRQLEQHPMSAATIARRLSSVSSWYAWAVDEEYADRNPAARVRRPVPDSDASQRGSLTLPQLRELLAAADGSAHPFAARDAFALRLMAFNGLRVAEVASANVGDLGFYLDRPGITITAKGRRRRFTPFTESTIAARDAWLTQLQAQPWIGANVEVRSRNRRAVRVPLFTLYGRPDRATPSALVWALHRTARDSALPDQVAAAITPHWLRRTFVTLALDAGVPLQQVQDAVGHASPQTTRGYDANRDSVTKHAVYGLDQLVNSTS